MTLFYQYENKNSPQIQKFQKTFESSALKVGEIWER